MIGFWELRWRALGESVYKVEAATTRIPSSARVTPEQARSRMSDDDDLQGNKYAVSHPSTMHAHPIE